MHVLRLLLLAAISILPTCLEASVVSRDLLEPGDGLLTYDPASGREWLDLPVTYLMSIESVAAELTNGGSFEGFSFADVEAVTQFISAQGIPQRKLHEYVEPSYLQHELARDFLGMVGPLRGADAFLVFPELRQPLASLLSHHLGILLTSLTARISQLRATAFWGRVFRSTRLRSRENTSYMILRWLSLIYRLWSHLKRLAHSGFTVTPLRSPSQQPVFCCSCRS